MTSQAPNNTSMSDPFRGMASSLTALLPSCSFWDPDSSDADYEISSCSSSSSADEARLHEHDATSTSVFQGKFQETSQRFINLNLQPEQSATKHVVEAKNWRDSRNLCDDDDIRRLCDAASASSSSLQGFYSPDLLGSACVFREAGNQETERTADAMCRDATTLADQEESRNPSVSVQFPINLKRKRDLKDCMSRVLRQ
jgi:hypothetical protein